MMIKPLREACHRRQTAPAWRAAGLPRWALAGLFAGLAAGPGALMAQTQASSPINAVCADGPAVEFRGYTARLENDLFANTDRDYTNGVSLTAISRDIPGGVDPACLPWPLRLQAALIQRLDPAFWQGDSTSPQNVVVKLGQSMYTPTDPTRSDLIVDDRPYAGLLYAGMSWNHRRLDVSNQTETLETREVTLGVIGPLSMARQMQDLVHRVKGVDRFLGWDNQLHNEPALQLAREQKWRDYRGAGSQIEGFALDSIRSIGLRVGNIETSASVGGEVRIGWNMPNDFGSYPIRPGAENRPPTGRFGGGSLPRGRAGAHLFAMLEGRVVGWDFTLDGNLLRRSHSVTRRPLVAQLATGFSVYGPVAGYGLKLAVMRVVRSREFDEQGPRHAFGSIALSVEY
jgi:lipid A 3-O-deacylase